MVNSRDDLEVMKEGGFFFWNEYLDCKTKNGSTCPFPFERPSTILMPRNLSSLPLMLLPISFGTLIFEAEYI